MSDQITLDKLHNWAEALLKEGGEVPSTIFMECEKKVAVIPIVGNLGEDSDQRAATMFKMGRVLAEDNEKSFGRLLRLFMVNEGWMLDTAEIPDHPISEDPNRIEVVLVSEYNTRTYKTDLLVSEIVRGEKVGLNKSQRGEAESALLEAFVTGYETYREVQ